MAGGRRGNGEGTIRKRVDGRWEARMSLPTGKQKCFTARTRAEVARRLTEALRQRDQGLPAVPERQTVAEYLTSWLDTCRPPVLAYATWCRYETLCRVHLRPVLGRVRLAQITPQHVRQVHARVLAAGRSVTTAHHVHACLHTALEHALRLGLVQRNVAHLVPAPPLRPARRQTLTAEQVRALRAAAQGDRLEALYTLALATGMRQGELLALRWRDVDLERGMLTISQALKRAPGGVAPGDPKTRGSARTIPLTPQAREAVRAHRARQAAERLVAGPDWADGDLVFCTPVGTPVERVYLTRHHLAEVARRAGVPRIRFHDLRHTAATLLLQEGVPAHVVAQLLGHSDVGTTMRIYAHVTEGLRAQATAAMERILGD